MISHYHYAFVTNAMPQTEQKNSSKTLPCLQMKFGVRYKHLSDTFCFIYSAIFRHKHAYALRKVMDVQYSSGRFLFSLIRKTLCCYYKFNHF